MSYKQTPRAMKTKSKMKEGKQKDSYKCIHNLQRFSLLFLKWNTSLEKSVMVIVLVCQCLLVRLLCICCCLRAIAVIRAADFAPPASVIIVSYVYLYIVTQHCAYFFLTLSKSSLYFIYILLMLFTTNWSISYTFESLTDMMKIFEILKFLPQWNESYGFQLRRYFYNIFFLAQIHSIRTKWMIA